MMKIDSHNLTILFVSAVILAYLILALALIEAAIVVV